MNSKDNAGLELRGRVKFTERDENGKVLRVTMANLVVDSARMVIRDSLRTAPADNKIQNLKVGNNNLSYGDNTGLIPPPDLADTDLVKTIFTKSVTTTSVMEGVRYAVLSKITIERNEANHPVTGQINLLTEYGLFTSGGKMIARVVNPIAKTSATALEIEWTIVI